jgi:hypothetical protein
MDRSADDAAIGELLMKLAKAPKRTRLPCTTFSLPCFFVILVYKRVREV